MIDKYLFEAPLVSADFKYPLSFIDYCANAQNDALEPWYILEDPEDATDWMETLREWYPSRNLIPFSRNFVTGDDLACFDGDDTSGNPKVHFVHTFASAGWEDRGHVADFHEWLKDVAEDHAAYLVQLAEDEAYEAESAKVAAEKNGETGKNDESV